MPMAWLVWAARPPAPAFFALGPSLARVRAARVRLAGGRQAPCARRLGRRRSARAAPRRPLKARGGKTRSAAARFASIRVGFGPGSEAERPAPRVSGRLWGSRLLGSACLGLRRDRPQSGGASRFRFGADRSAWILFARGGCAFLRRHALAPRKALRRRLMRSALDSPRRRAADGLTRRVGADSRWLENGGAQRFRRSMAAASRRRLSALSSPSRAWIASWVACLAFSQAPSAPSSVA